MAPGDEITALRVEIAQQREKIALLEARARNLESRLAIARRMLGLSTLVVVLAAGIGLVVAWSLGAFESRLTYWRERGQDCGRVNYFPNGRLMDQSAAEQSVACFAVAHARCKATVLTRYVAGMDTSETYTFVVEPWDGGGGCDVGLHYSFGIVASPRVTTRDVQCGRVTSDNGALTIGGCQGFSDITML